MTDSKQAWGFGRIKFLEKFSLIEKAKLSGWPLSMIYREYQDELNITYVQFTKYVKRYFGQTDEKLTIEKKTKPLPVVSPHGPLSHPPEQPGFHYQSKLDKSKLI